MTKAQIAKAGGIRLDIGCGANKHPGSVGMDVRKLPGVDIVHDLTKVPWPLPDSCAHTVILSHVWEHIQPWATLPVMEEIHRVCQPEAHVLIAAPYGVGPRFVQDPTHCNPSNEWTFHYWDPETSGGALYEVYRPSPFKIVSWEVIPVGYDKDFNVVLKVLKETAAKPAKAKAPKSRRRAR